MCVYVCVCVCVGVCVCTHMCVGVYIYTHTHTCMGAHTHVCINVCVYIQLIESHQAKFKKAIKKKRTKKHFCILYTYRDGHNVQNGIVSSEKVGVTFLSKLF